MDSNTRVGGTQTEGEQAGESTEGFAGHVLIEIKKAAAAVEQQDAATRQDIKACADHLIEQAARAHVSATTGQFRLVDDEDGMDGIYGYLSVNSQRFTFATRSDWEDLDSDPNNDNLFSGAALEDWPVEWVRLVARRNAMTELAEELLAAMRRQLNTPNATVSLPPELRRPNPRVVAQAEELKFPKVVDAWRETQRQIHTRPESALRSACNLLETVCTHILHECSVEVPDNPILTTLYRAAKKQIPMDGDEVKLAGGLMSVVDGIAHARSHLSDAHGSGPEEKRPSAAHVELAVTAAGALAVHFMQVLSERKRVSKNRPPQGEQQNQ
jgi:hypothetical protein